MPKIRLVGKPRSEPTEPVLAAPRPVVRVSRPIPGFPGYRVYRDGRVINSRGWVLKLDPEARVTLCRGSVQRRVRVAVLVLEAFRCKRSEGLIACHKDDNPFNNRVSNLYWGTYSDNVQDAIRNGTHKGNTSIRSVETLRKMSESHKGKKLPLEQRRKMGIAGRSWWILKTDEWVKERSRKSWETRRANNKKNP